MACLEGYQKQLSEYIDGALDRNAVIEMETHLKTCTMCQEELEALRTLSRELAALETIKTPGDFLDQVHEKIENRSFIKRIIKKFFQPFHLKIPLEAAALAATVILVFSMWEMEKDEIKLVSAPAKNQQGELYEKESAEEKKLLKDKKVHEFPSRANIQLKAAPSPSPAATETFLEEKPQSPIEFLLVIQSIGQLKAATHGIEKKDTPPALSASAGNHKDMARERDRLPRMQEAKKSPIEETISSVEKLIHSVDGVITNSSHDDSIVLEVVIPSSRYQDFLKAVAKMGTLQDPPKTYPEKDGDSILLRITLKD